MAVRLLRLCAAFVFALLLGIFLARFFWPRGVLLPAPIRIVQPRLERPEGMAPAAFEAFVRACNSAKIHPFRIGQTIGDHPRSVGYHKRDGTLNHRGQKLDYCAAVDLGTWDLNRAQINALLENLGAQGFASFYREGPNWKGNEHIHAIYAGLLMKPQLRRQVRQWVRERRRSGKKSFQWQVKTQRFWRNSRHSF